MTATQTPPGVSRVRPVAEGQALGTPEAGAGSMTEASCRRLWYAYREAGTGMQLQSTFTCPKFSYQAVEAMPTDACQFFYDCKGCDERLKPLAGDCCVFCSYGSVLCPPIQSNLRCCVPKVH